MIACTSVILNMNHLEMN